MLAKKTLELNPHHPVIKEMLKKVKSIDNDDDDMTELKEYADLIFNMAMLNSGFLIENPTDFTNPLQKLLKVGFGLNRDAPIEEIEIDISTLVDEEKETEVKDEEGTVEIEDVSGEDSEDKKEDL